MELTLRQRRALEEICDAFCPAGNGAPPARQLGVADALLAAVSLNPRVAVEQLHVFRDHLNDPLQLRRIDGAR